jgi:hypothetical protein
MRSETLMVLSVNFVPPALSLVGFVLLTVARATRPNFARGLDTGLMLSLLGSLAAALPALFMAMGAGDRPLGEGGLFTLFMAMVGFGLWVVLLALGYGLGALFAGKPRPSDR